MIFTVLISTLSFACITVTSCDCIRYDNNCDPLFAGEDSKYVCYPHSLLKLYFGKRSLWRWWLILGDCTLYLEIWHSLCWWNKLQIFCPLTWRTGTTHEQFEPSKFDSWCPTSEMRRTSAEHFMLSSSALWTIFGLFRFLSNLSSSDPLLVHLITIANQMEDGT